MEPFWIEERDGRYDKLRTYLSQNGIDAAYITGAKNYEGCFYYVAGPGQKVVIDYYHILLPSNDEPTIFLGTRKRPSQQDRYKATMEKNWVKKMALDEEDCLAELLARFNHKNGKIGVIGDVLNFKDYLRLRRACPNAEIIDISSEYTELMRANDALALSNNLKSMEIVEKCCVALPDIIRKAKTASQVVTALDTMMYNLGSDYTYNKYFRHYRKEEYVGADNNAICPGDVAYAEITSCFGGMWIQRVIPFSVGEPNAEYDKLFEISQKAKDYASSFLKVGNTTQDVLDAINESIHAEGYLAPSDFVFLPPAHLCGMKIDMGTFVADKPFNIEEAMSAVIHCSVKNPETGHILFGPADAYVIENGVANCISMRQEHLMVF